MIDKLSKLSSYLNKSLRKEDAIKNEEHRDTGNIGHTRHGTKTNKQKHITTQKTTKISNTNPTKIGDRQVFIIGTT